MLPLLSSICFKGEKYRFPPCVPRFFQNFLKRDAPLFYSGIQKILRSDIFVGKTTAKKSDRRPQITVPVLKRLSASIAFPYRETISVSCGELFRYSSLLPSLLTAQDLLSAGISLFKEVFCGFFVAE